MPSAPTIENAVTIQSAVTIESPRGHVWEILADVARQPEWMRDALSIEILTDGPMGVGSRMRVPTKIGFLRTTDIMEVTEFEPPARWTVVHQGLVTGQGTFLLEEVGARTRVEWNERLAAPLGALGRAAFTLFRPVLRRQFQADLERLREICESGAPLP